VIDLFLAIEKQMTDG